MCKMHTRAQWETQRGWLSVNQRGVHLEPVWATALDEMEETFMAPSTACTQ